MRRVCQETLGGGDSLIDLSLKKPSEISHACSRVFGQRRDNIPVLLAATDDGEVFRIVELDTVVVQRQRRRGRLYVLGRVDLGSEANLRPPVQAKLPIDKESRG